MPSAIDEYIGKRIRIVRKARGWTQMKLAEKVGGLKFQQIQKYEVGGNRVLAVRLVQIAEALGVPVTELLPPPKDATPLPIVEVADHVALRKFYKAVTLAAAYYEEAEAQ